MPAREKRREERGVQEAKRSNMRGERNSWGRRSCIQRIPGREKNMRGGEVHKMSKQRRDEER